MKPTEIAKLFTEYLEESTTPKGVKIHAFFSHLDSSQKRIVSKNIAKAYAAFLQEEKELEERRKKNKKEIAELKKRAKELGLIISEA
jgi:Na+/phosphate symporter